MSRYQIHRARMETHRMPDDVAAFAAAWTQWKLELGLMDFTDLIEVCLRDVPTAPDNPNIIVIDEAQDLDYLQMALIRKWGAAASSLVVVGDPDQCIYRWRGSDPSAFSTPQIPAENKRVLAQSYRVPNEVHAKAVGWISQVRDREPVEYYPRDAEGEIRTVTATYTFPEPALEDAERYLAQGKQVMFLASCSYMITPLLQVLRRQGIPFHKPTQPDERSMEPAPEAQEHDKRSGPDPGLPEAQRDGPVVSPRRPALDRRAPGRRGHAQGGPTSGQGARARRGRVRRGRGGHVLGRPSTRSSPPRPWKRDSPATTSGTRASSWATRRPAPSSPSTSSVRTG